MKNIASLLIICIISIGSVAAKKFPKFNKKSHSGTEFTQESLIGKKTFVVMSYLGEPTSMKMMTDLDSFAQTMDKSKYQILCFVENTPEQMDMFYEDSANTWSQIRKLFEIKELNFEIIPMCEEAEDVAIKKGNITIGSQCKALRKKVGSKEAPAILFVDEEGKIGRLSNVYTDKEDIDHRFKWIATFMK